MCRHRYYYNGCHAGTYNLPCGINYLPADRPGDRCVLYGEYCSEEYCDGCPDDTERENTGGSCIKLQYNPGINHLATLGR